MNDKEQISILHEKFEEKLYREGWMIIWLTRDDNGNYHKSMTQKKWLKFLLENGHKIQD